MAVNLPVDLPEALAGRRPRIVVLGDVMVSPGGAGHTAANLAALGADTTIVTTLGDDRTGEVLIEALRSAGVSSDHVVAVAGRITAGDQLMLPLDAGDHSPLPAEASGRLVAQLRQALRGCDALVIGDYDTGVLGPDVVEALTAVRADIPLLVVGSLASWQELRPDVVTSNAAEMWAAACGAGLPGAVPDGAGEHSQLARIVAGHRAAGRRIVFTNGCFDVLHRGHVSYLDQAKQLGDVLIVAVNDDAGVRRLKGPERPVNTAADRAAVLAGLSCVDYVTQFSEDTPVSLIRLLKPDVYAKGGDYSPEMLPETPVVHSFGGEVHILGYVADHSTSAVIEKIRSA